MDTKVLAMALIRVFFGLLSLAGGYMMFRLNDIQQAVRINGILGSIGPFVLLSVSAIGIAGLATQLDIRKILMVVVGVMLIMMGTR